MDIGKQKTRADRRPMSGQCPVGAGWVLRASRLDIGGCVCFSGKIGKTGQNRTFPDIGVIQIADGGDDEEDRLKAECPNVLRTCSERELRA